jgi:hypothetical protein
MNLKSQFQQIATKKNEAVRLESTMYTLTNRASYLVYTQQYSRTKCFRSLPSRRMHQRHLQTIQSLPIHGPTLRKHILIRTLLANQVHCKRTQRAVQAHRRTKLPKLDP